MEYIQGKTLEHIIKTLHSNQKHISLHNSVRIIRNIAEALSYAHTRNMVHSDVKPSNVLMENTNRTVLIDFGFAKIVTGNTEMSGDIYGTPADMAPEQAMGMPRRNYSDIYSLGILFFELVTGQPPFYSENAMNILMMHINDPLPLPRSIKKSIPRRIEKIILKATEKNPKDRYTTMEDMLIDIKKLREAKTDHLPTATLALPSLLPKDTHSKARLVLHILDTGQLLDLPKGAEFLLGRKHGNQSPVPDVDFTPFEGQKWGISRKHARVLIGNQGVSIIDLDSMNGTWFAGKRIEPNIPFRLHHGDTIQLGDLKVQVLVYTEGTA